MTRSQVRGVVAAAVAVLLVAVMWVRDDTGSATSGWVATPAAVAEPSPSALLPDWALDPLEIGLDGVHEVRLGMPTRSLHPWVDSPVPSPGCREVDVEAWGAREWFVAARLVDDVVAAVRVVSHDLRPDPVLDIQNRLGPTLGSDIRQASRLPGARTAIHRPFGRSGTGVTVVVVPNGSNEVVYADAPQQSVRTGREVGGRITSIEVRAPAARACSVQAVQAAATGADPPLLQLDGVPAARLGSPLAEVVAQPDVRQVESSADGRCRLLELGESSGPRVFVVDGVVASVKAGPGNTTGVGVSAGDGLREIRAALPQLDGVPDERLIGDVDATAVEGGPTVRLHLGSGSLWVPDVESPLVGSPVVLAVSVLAPGSVHDVSDCCLQLRPRRCSALGATGTRNASTRTHRDEPTRSAR